MPKKINIRAVYRDGLLTPLGYVDIEEGDVVSLTVEVESERSKEERKRKTCSPRLSTNEWLERARKRREASRTRITAEQILEARDADRT